MVDTTSAQHRDLDLTDRRRLHHCGISVGLILGRSCTSREDTGIDSAVAVAGTSVTVAVTVVVAWTSVTVAVTVVVAWTSVTVAVTVVAVVAAAILGR
jgi:hypothetical protein